VQNVSTRGAHDWESFQIGDRTFLAVANHISSVSNSTDIESEIFEFRFDDGEAHVESVQNISTYSARDWESFKIGGRTFLAVANSYSTVADSHAIDSQIFVFHSDKGGQFKLVQNVSTHGAADWQSFQIGDRSFLAIANAISEGFYETDSEIFEWNGCRF
jgi:hypothetical protein